MINLGTKVTESEFNIVLDYLATNFPPAMDFLINVNKATDAELEIALQISHKQAVAIVRYRDKNGKFKSIGDLKRVPNVNAKQIDANKDRVFF